MQNILDEYFEQTDKKLTRKQVLKIQKDKFQKLIEFVLKNSEFYKEEFNNAGITLSNFKEKNLADFPIINKQDVMRNFNRLVTVNDLRQTELEEFDKNSLIHSLYKEKYHIIHSSGSTGRPYYFVYGQKDWNEMLMGMFRAAFWGINKQQLINFIEQKPKVLYLAATNGRYGGMMGVSQALATIGADALYLDVNLPLKKLVQRVCKFNPDAIIGYPTAIKILTEGLKEENHHLDLLRIVTAGEPLSKNLRRYFEKEYQIPIINYYGASESLALGVEVGNDDGMYLFDDLNIIERRDNKILLTNLYNYTQPLIRYELTDELNFTHNNDSAFTTSRVLQSRSEDIMWFKDKDNLEFLHPLSVEGFQIPGLIDYQFIQTSKKSFTLKLEIDSLSSKRRIKHEIYTQLLKILNENNLNFVSIKILFGQIKPEKYSGKKKLMVPLKEKKA